MGDDELAANAISHDSLGANSRAPSLGFGSDFFGFGGGCALECCDPFDPSNLSNDRDLQGEGPLQRPLRSDADITRTREGDEDVHRVDFGIVDLALHNSYAAWELSKRVLLLQDVEWKDRPMDDITASLFSALIRVSSCYILFHPLVGLCVPDWLT